MSTSQANHLTEQIVPQQQHQLPLKRQPPFSSMEPPFGDYHQFSSPALDLRLKEPEAIVVKSPVLLQAIILLQLVPVVMIAPSVQKRHIYDIINDLEGIGLIEKKLKNRNRWKYRWELMCQGQGRLIRMLLSYRCLSH
ncbi:uncharacterized protein LOC114302068 isoform X4 [Camellia sinensis]|uniref:uncharacterized protein LOC114302068 isoform X4 n=1 Tax=Camellia sinensis TaxID=4442 RepID=UPI0010365A33|nr:uncharacterized protein LOC114302068 isoform X4 [Camellia sinensis]